MNRPGRGAKAGPARAAPAPRRASVGRVATLPPLAAPAERALTYADLIALVELIERANAFSEFRLKAGAIEVEFKRKPADGPAAYPERPVASPAADPAAVTTAAPDSTGPATASAALKAQAAAPERGLPPGAIAIAAPMVGTFYRSPQPGAAPFVETGSRVERGATLCIIEVMKLMNSVEAEVAGTVIDIRVGDAQPVRPGQVLIVLDPAR